MLSETLMRVTYANNHTWRKTIHPEILPDFGKSNAKKISKLLPEVAKLGITTETKPLEAEFFTWFSPLYDSLIVSRKNFGGYDIVGSTLGNETAKHPYYSFTLAIDGQPFGGAIFTLREDRLSLVYRAFPSQFPDHFKTRCTPALLAEYRFHELALAHGKPKLAHGADKNPYGLNSAIGLAIFKLSVGCRPYLQKTYEVNELDVSQLQEDVLVLELPEDGKAITRATLACTKERLPKYEQLFKYPAQLHVDVYHL